MRAARLPSLVPALVAVPLVALLAWLGTWQLERAGEQRREAAEFAAGAAAPVALPAANLAPRFLHVRLEGHYLTARQVLLDNMTHEGRVGYRVLTPLRTARGDTVLVDRGWVPLGASRAALPEVAVGEAPRLVTGRLDELPRAGIELAGAADVAWPRVLNYPTWDALRATLGGAIYPRIVLLDASEPDGFVRDWRPTGLSSDRHVGYAVQWYALAVTLVVLVGIVTLRTRGSPA